MKKILFLSNHFLTLFLYRKELISRLINEKYEVYISTPADDRNSFFTELGCHVINTEMNRRGKTPVSDLKLVKTYINIMKKINPDIVFSYTIKPNIYGSMASNWLNYKQICNITGTGATFVNESLLSKIARVLYRFSIKKAYKVFFQNTGDRDYFINHGMVSQNWEMIPGSGVDLKAHPFLEMLGDEVIKFIFIGRVMKVKGIDQFLECAKNIKNKYNNTVFYIAGLIEEEKYKDVIKKYSDEGIVEYLGFQKDLNKWIGQCHCTILPSLGGEGIPNSLLESAAVGRVCIASNTNGAKDVVDDGKNGYLFKPGSTQDLTAKVEKFINLSNAEKQKMGKNGHEKVANEFNREIVIQKYMDEIENTR